MKTKLKKRLNFVVSLTDFFFPVWLFATGLAAAKKSGASKPNQLAWLAVVFGFIGQETAKAALDKFVEYPEKD